MIKIEIVVNIFSLPFKFTNTLTTREFMKKKNILTLSYFGINNKFLYSWEENRPGIKNKIVNIK